jgi:orotate phosphoribosyltransferase
MAARRGHFRLESGHHGDLWLDLDGLFSRPDAVRGLAARLAGLLAPHRPAVVCGPLTGGGFLAQLVAAELGARCCWAERLAGGTYRIPASLRAGLAGARTAVVDDVINAGSAVRATLAELDGCGAVPVAVGALLLLGPPAPAAERGLPLHRLDTQAAGLWEPADCPRCAAGEPLEDLLGA